MRRRLKPKRRRRLASGASDGPGDGLRGEEEMNERTNERMNNAKVKTDGFAGF